MKIYKKELKDRVIYNLTGKIKIKKIDKFIQVNNLNEYRTGIYKFLYDRKDYSIDYYDPSMNSPHSKVIITQINEKSILMEIER